MIKLISSSMDNQQKLFLKNHVATFNRWGGGIFKNPAIFAFSVAPNIIIIPQDKFMNSIL
jgi:hypothetical protein